MVGLRKCRDVCKSSTDPVSRKSGSAKFYTNTKRIIFQNNERKKFYNICPGAETRPTCPRTRERMRPTIPKAPAQNARRRRGLDVIKHFIFVTDAHNK